MDSCCSSIQNITVQETPEAAFCAAFRLIVHEARRALLTGNELLWSEWPDFGA
jgi:hypothetical protein